MDWVFASYVAVITVIAKIAVNVVNFLHSIRVGWKSSSCLRARAFTLVKQLNLFIAP